MKMEKSLSDLAEILKEKNSGDLSEYANYLTTTLLSAGTLASIILSPSPIEAIQNFATGVTLTAFRPGNLMKFLHDKFNYGKSREFSATCRYEKLFYVNLVIVHIAAREAFKAVIIPYLSKYVDEINIDELSRERILQFANEQTQNLEKRTLDLPSMDNAMSIGFYLTDIFKPMEQMLYDVLNKSNVNFEKLIETCVKKANVFYNAFIVNLCSEFPEFAIWVNISKQEEHILEQKEAISDILEAINANFTIITEQIKESLVESILTRVKAFQKDECPEEPGLKNILIAHELLLDVQKQDIKNILKEETWSDISAHHNAIKTYLKRPILDNNDDLKGILLSSNEDMYIPQSFKYVRFYKEKFNKNILIPNYWEKKDNKIKSGNDIGSILLKAIIDPHSSTSPIIILGNPGAGKSMLSHIFAARLIESSEFVPFLIKLRDVNTDNTKVNEHINQGLKKSLAGDSNVSWISWAKEFKDRTPVIILDGFDELLQASATELNGYLLEIQELQNQALNYDIFPRVILTSRLAIMQDIKIPDGTLVIKLDSFNEERQKLWIDKWNRLQNAEKFKPFRIPNNTHIQELAKEPLLLFMLAIYDFEESELQLAEKENFSQSKLYDRLFDKFTIRQLEKDTSFIHLDHEEEEERIELFRLRLGIVALMMFLNDKTDHSSNKLNEELKGFELSNGNIDPNEIIGGFFFIHENKATKENGDKLLNFEFLHKTFGEFLAADFLLRIAAYRIDKSKSRRKLSKEGTLRFCFGYNWLHKHPKILSFMKEHSSNVLGNLEKEIELFIKDELESIFDTNSLMFPTNEINLMNPLPVIEHLAIYSQNLILLWTCITNGKTFEFRLNPSQQKLNSITDYSNLVTTQNPDDGDSLTIITWKRMTNLWKTIGNAFAAAKIGEWIDVDLKDNRILITNKKKEVSNYYQTAAQISLNDYELLISYNHSTFRLEDVNKIVRRKPQLTTLAIELINNRFDVLISTHSPKKVIKLCKDMLNDTKLRGYKVSSYIELLINLAKFDSEFLKELEIIFLKNKIFRIGSIITSDLIELFIEKEKYDTLYGIIENFAEPPSNPNDEFRILEVLVDKFPISHRLVKFASDKRKKISLDNFYKLTVLLFEYLPDRQKDISLKALDELYERSRSGRSLTPNKRIKLFELVIGQLGITQQRLRELKNLYSEHFEQLSVCSQLSLLELLATYEEDRQLVQREMNECYDNLCKKKILTSEVKIKFLAILLQFSPNSSLIEEITGEFIYDTNSISYLGIKEKNRLVEVILAYAPKTPLFSHILTEVRKSEQYKWASL